MQKNSTALHEFLIGSAWDYVSKVHGNADSAHDLSHLDRVRRNALAIAGKEGGDLLVIELSSLLHDVDDPKLTQGTKPFQNLREWFLLCRLDDRISKAIEDVVANVGFKATGLSDNQFSKEVKIVRDADRLEAIGAIGIARCFSFNGHKNRALFIPEIVPITTEMYRKNSSKERTSAINHFFEKLLVLKDGFLTSEGFRLARERHAVMLKFLESFFSEWFAGSPIPGPWEALIRSFNIELAAPVDKN